MKIISISGVDGSGKSTQVNLLKEHLEKKGARVFYFHAVTFSIANTGDKKPGDARAVTKASWLKVQLRKIALLIDLLRFEKLITKLEKDDYTHLISDRYFYDSLINIAYLSRNNALKSFGIHTIAHLIPHPNHAFFLHVTPEEIRSRAREIEQDEEYLASKTSLLEKYTPDWHLTTVNGHDTPENVFETIRKNIA